MQADDLRLLGAGVPVEILKQFDVETLKKIIERKQREIEDMQMRRYHLVKDIESIEREIESRSKE